MDNRVAPVQLFAVRRIILVVSPVESGSPAKPGSGGMYQKRLCLRPMTFRSDETNHVSKRDVSIVIE